MAGLLLASGAAFAQGLGLGIGVDDVRLVGTAAPVIPCGALQADHTDGCNAALVMLVNG